MKHCDNNKDEDISLNVDDNNKLSSHKIQIIKNENISHLNSTRLDCDIH